MKNFTSRLKAAWAALTSDSVIVCAFKKEMVGFGFINVSKDNVRYAEERLNEEYWED